MRHRDFDPRLFEPYFPTAVRALLAAARKGKGAAAQWLASADRVGDSIAALRGHPEPMDPESTGWLVGMGTFGDDLGSLARVMVRERHTEPARFVLEAFAAGIQAGVATQKRQWKSIETISELAKAVPDALRDVLPIGLVSEQGLTRGVALRLAQRAGPSARSAIEAARASADAKGKKHLEAALAALAPDPGTGPSREGDLLARLLAAWTQTFDPALVAPITRLGSEEARRRGPLEAKSKGELEGAWLALAAKADAGDVDRLLGTPWPGAWKAGLARIRALEKHPADPRLVQVAAIAASSYVSWASHPVHSAAKALAHRHAPQAQIGPAPRALLAEATASAGKGVDVASLLQACREGPVDAGRLAVLADALQVNGDPRGEFIALQLAIAEQRADTAATRRAAKLLEANIDAWTGPIPGALRPSRRFERGFLTAVRVKASSKDFGRSITVPEWGTVEELHLERSTVFGVEAALPPLMARLPRLRALVVEGYGVTELFDAIARSGPYPALIAIGSWDWLPKERPAGLPNVRLLGLSDSFTKPDVAFIGAANAGFEALNYFARFTEWDAVIRQFDGSGLRQLRLAQAKGGWGAHQGWGVQLQGREEAAALFHGEGRHQPDAMLPVLKSVVASGRRSIDVQLPHVGKAAAQAELEAAQRKLGRTVTLRVTETPFDLWKI